MAVPAGGSAKVQLRLINVGRASPAAAGSPSSNNSSPPNSTKSQRQAGSLSYFADFDSIFSQRIREADEFYGEIQKDIADEDARRVQRQAFAGMLWSKQFYYYDIP